MKHTLYKIILFFIMGCEQDYDKQCIVGAVYKVCPPKENNPFVSNGNSNVIITDKKKGYVQYCHTYDYKTKYTTYFTRSCEEFIESVNRCK